MKTKALQLLLLSSFLLVACDDKDNPGIKIDEQALLGTWNYKTVYVNGIHKEISNYLSLDKNHIYGKCYISGSWELESNILTLHNLWGGDMTYKILSISETKLVLKIETTRQKYGQGFPEFTDDQVLTIVEEFVKSK